MVWDFQTTICYFTLINISSTCSTGTWVGSRGLSEEVQKISPHTDSMFGHSIPYNVCSNLSQPCFVVLKRTGISDITYLRSRFVPPHLRSKNSFKNCESELETYWIRQIVTGWVVGWESVNMFFEYSQWVYIIWKWVNARFQWSPKSIY
jgi:hypothetical protein